MREHLLGYLLGALEPDEEAAVELALTSDPKLREELITLRLRVAPLDATAEDYDPPPGLALRTCAKIPGSTPVLKSSSKATFLEPSASLRARWSLADWIVAAGVVAAGAILFLPVIANSREVARVIECQDKLRQLGMGLISYSELNNEHRFPVIPSDGNRAFAGFVATTLRDAGCVTDGSNYICPASTLADNPTRFRVPTVEELMEAEGVQLAALQQVASGSYGFNLGVVEHGKHVAARNRGRDCFALMSDAPNCDSPSGRTANHGGRGQNVLYEDGHVKYIVDFPVEHFIDHPFRNRHGQMEAGVDSDDAVIGSSQTRPFIRTVSRVQDR